MTLWSQVQHSNHRAIPALFGLSWVQWNPSWKTTHTKDEEGQQHCNDMLHWLYSPSSCLSTSSSTSMEVEAADFAFTFRLFWLLLADLGVTSVICSAQQTHWCHFWPVWASPLSFALHNKHTDVAFGQFGHHLHHLLCTTNRVMSLLANLGITSVICSAQQTHWCHFWSIWASPQSFALHHKHTDVTFGQFGHHLYHLLCTTNTLMSLLVNLGITSIICSAPQTHWCHFWPIWASPPSFALHNKHTDVTFGQFGHHLNHLLCTTNTLMSLLVNLGITSIICSAQQTHWCHFWPIWASPPSFALHHKHTDVTFGQFGHHLRHLLCTTNTLMSLLANLGITSIICSAQQTHWCHFWSIWASPQSFALHHKHTDVTFGKKQIPCYSRSHAGCGRPIPQTFKSQFFVSFLKTLWFISLYKQSRTEIPTFTENKTVLEKKNTETPPLILIGPHKTCTDFQWKTLFPSTRLTDKQRKLSDDDDITQKNEMYKWLQSLEIRLQTNLTQKLTANLLKQDPNTAGMT